MFGLDRLHCILLSVYLKSGLMSAEAFGGRGLIRQGTTVYWCGTRELLMTTHLNIYQGYIPTHIVVCLQVYTVGTNSLKE
jgi:hypothetical protein